MRRLKKFFSGLMAVVLAVSTVMSGLPAVAHAAAATVTSVGGWNETLYMELSGVSDSNVTAVSYSGASTGSLTGDDLKYLVRDVDGRVRIDIPGLKPGTYSVSVTTSSGTVTQSGIVVTEQDRSGYAHFNYTEGVGAYKDDGTLKDNAIVLYVTDENKNTITLSHKGVTVTGIGNILNSVGEDTGSGTTSKGGKPNTNQGILKLLALDNIPLVVRFVGCVSNTGLYKSGTFNASSTPKVDGLTIYDSLDNGGSVGDNGHMARMKSAKNVTLEGIGTDATIDGWGFHFMCESAYADLGKSFEVRNLTFINTPEDAVGMEGVQAGTSASSAISASVERCWVHNCSFYVPNISSPAESDKSEGDGSVDFKRGQYFTASYNYYEGCHKTNLIGSSDSSIQYNLTYHHNVYKYVESRGPLARNANIHMYNNAFIGQTSYAMDARANSFIFSESNIFYMCKNPQTTGGGVIKSYNDSFASYIGDKAGVVVDDKTTNVSNSCKYTYGGIDYSKFETDSKLSYIPTGDYKVSEDHTYVMKDLYANAGPMKSNQKTAEEVSMSEMSLIPSGVTATNLTSSLPYSGTPGKISKTVYAFTVDTVFDFEMSASGAVLCNEAGVAFLEGSGSVKSLPAGTYMIQAVNFSAGTASSLGSFKDVTVSSIKITGADPDYDPNKLTGIALNKTSMNMVVDSASTLTVSYTPSTTTADKTVTWSTSNSSVATVTNGVVVAVGKGSAVITAKVGEFTATCNVTVTEPIALTGIALNKTSTEILSGSTETLTVSYTPSNTTEATDVSWSTGNASVATVTNGVVKGIGEGTTTITAKVGNFTATCTVTVKIPEVAEGAYVHVFDTDGKTSDFYSITGSLSSSKGTITYNGQTLNQCLKIESSTNISFTAPAEGTLKLYFGGSTSASGKAIKVDGKSLDIGSDQILTVNVAAGSHTITKDDSIFLWVMEYAPLSSGGSSEEHTHSYTASVTTAATCETAGVRTYTCSCSDSYTEAIPATGHTYSSSYTVDVEATETTAGSKSRHCTAAGCDAKTDITVIPATGSSSGDHTHAYTVTVSTEPSCASTGLKVYTCSCGSTYTETIEALGHSFSSSYTVDVEPTETTTGSKSRHCTVSGCAARTDVVIIPATGSTATTATSVKLLEVGGWLESAYVEWEPVSGATGYNVYIRKTSSETYTQLDNELIRKYPNYWRADALGLTAGTYIMKVVP
ncbi:MAG: Ig-like domain-containing protein, partial [Lachnospira sp.]|nr:Ig-like domain-containing protein [Lachnospira sp.]